MTVGSGGHNVRAVLEQLIVAFIEARGCLEERLQYKQLIKKACHEMQIAWEHMSKLFRETVRTFEDKERLKLEAIIARRLTAPRGLNPRLL